MPINLLEAPYQYRLRRGRKWETIRDQVSIVVQELSPADAPVAIRLERDGQPDELRAWNGRLLKRAVDENGRPFSPEEFKAALFPKDASTSADRGAFDPDDYPTRRIRWGIGAKSPLHAKSTKRPPAKVETEYGKAALRPIRSAAADFLAQAIVSIDGVVHLATAEPVLAAISRGGVSSIQVAVDPSAYQPVTLFRLDAIEEAREFLEIQGSNSHPASPFFEILRDDAILRDDEWSIATWLVRTCAFAETSEVKYEDDTDLFRVIVQRLEPEVDEAAFLAAEARIDNPLVPLRDLPAIGMAEDILEDLVSSLNAATPAGRRITVDPIVDELLVGARQRWELAERRGRGSDTREPGAADDAEAMRGPLY